MKVILNEGTEPVEDNETAYPARRRPTKDEEEGGVKATKSAVHGNC